MLHKLNYDCWNVLLKYLTLKEQLTLSQVSEDVHTSLQKYWARIQKLWINNEILNHFEQHPNQMHDFFKFASTSLQELNLEFGSYSESPDNTIALLQSWKPYTFANLYSLDCKFLEPDTVTFSQLTLLQLTQLFPQVTKLSMFRKHVEDYVWLWSYLKYLILINCESIDNILFDANRIKLERLSLLYYDMPYYYNQNVLNMVETTGSFHTFKARTMILNFWSELDFEHLPIELFKDLHQIFLDDTYVHYRQLHSQTATLPFENLLKTNKIWDIVAACNSLQIFHISHVDLDVEFLRESSTCLHRVLSSRTKDMSPLTIHFYKTGLEYYQQEVVELLKHPNLVFTFNQWQRDEGLVETPSFWIDYTL